MRSDNADYVDAARKMMEFSKRRDRFICGAEDHKGRLMRYDVTLLALGLPLTDAHKSAATLARSHGVTAARINSLLKQFQDRNELPPMEGQNSSESRKEKKQSRKETLKRN